MDVHDIDHLLSFDDDVDGVLDRLEPGELSRCLWVADALRVFTALTVGGFITSDRATA